MDKGLMGQVVLSPRALDGGRVWASGAKWMVLWVAGLAKSTKACGTNYRKNGKIRSRGGVLVLAVLRGRGKQRFGSGLGLRSSRVYT